MNKSREERCKDKSHRAVLSKRKLKNSMKNLSAALQAKIDPLDNQLGYKSEQENLQSLSTLCT